MGLWKSGWLLILLDQLNVGFSTLFVVPTKVLKKQQEAENIQVPFYPGQHPFSKRPHKKTKKNAKRPKHKTSF
jgi:hypothetical protein